MASIIGFIGAGIGLVASAAVTGFAFAGGAEAFQAVEMGVKKATEKKLDAQYQGDRARNENKNPFNDTRFLDNLEKRTIAELGKK